MPRTDAGPLRRTRLLMSSVALAACGPVDLEAEPAPLIEHCGSTTPTQLLSLEPHEMTALRNDSVVRHGSRWLVAINTLSEPYDGSAGAGNASVLNSRVVSIDECGQQPPTVVAEGIDRIFPPPTATLPWLGCSSESQQMYTIDPDGEREPSPLGTVEGCWFRSTTESLWMRSQREPDGRHVLLELTTDDFADGTLFRDAGTLAPFFSSYTVGDDRVWLVSPERELVELDLETRIYTLLAEDVEQVVLASDPRFLLWGSEGDLFEYGRWTIYDRQTEQHTEVQVAGQSDVRLHGTRYSMVFEARPENGNYEFSVVQFPSLESTTLVGDWTTFADNGPGDLLLQDRDTGSLYLRSAGATEPELLYDANLHDVRLDDDEVWAWDLSEYQAPSLQEIETSLLWIPIRGGEPEVIIDGVYQPLGLDDGRWLSVRGWDGDGTGDLLVLDPMTGTQRRIDRDVSVWFARHSSVAFPYPGEDIVSAEDPVLYSVYDDGERSGLWTTALAPASIP